MRVYKRCIRGDVSFHGDHFLHQKTKICDANVGGKEPNGLYLLYAPKIITVRINIRYMKRISSYLTLPYEKNETSELNCRN
jgi:hypothetical protein